MGFRICCLALLTIVQGFSHNTKSHFSSRRFLVKNSALSLFAPKKALAKDDVSFDLYFYSDVDAESCLQFTKMLREAQKQSIKHQHDKKLSKPLPVNIHVQSNGGALMPALHVCDIIDSMSVPVHSFVEGTVASAATLMTVVADKRYMYKRSMLLLHQPSISIGDSRFDELRDTAYNMEKIYDCIIRLYQKHTGLDRKTIEGIILNEKYTDAYEAKRLSFVDEIL